MNVWCPYLAVGAAAGFCSRADGEAPEKSPVQMICLGCSAFADLEKWTSGDKKRAREREKKEIKGIPALSGQVSVATQ